MRVYLVNDSKEVRRRERRRNGCGGGVEVVGVINDFRSPKAKAVVCGRVRV